MYKVEEGVTGTSSTLATMSSTCPKSFPQSRLASGFCDPLAGYSLAV
jgi:hypothetical protein